MLTTRARMTGRRPVVETLEERTLLAGDTLAITLHLAAATAPAGDYVDVIAPRLVLTGQTDPGALVFLQRPSASGVVQTLAATVADAEGHYQFKITTAIGTTDFTARATEPTGNRATASLAVTRANPAIAWNSIALQAIRTSHLPAPNEARALAIVEVSVFDAVNAINPQYSSYGNITVKAPRGASAAAAASAAAETALVGLFPSQQGVLSAELATALAAFPAGASRNAGVSLGTSVANQVLALRSDDGANVKVNYVPGNGPDSWVPTPPTYAPAVDPQWGSVTPFVLTSGTQFQPPPPPAINSAEYAAEVNQVETLGSATSTVRTAAETASARFWSDLAGTFDPPGHWNQIGEIAALNNHSSLQTSARMFALLDMALADAGIEAWGVKYTDNTARPVTIIRDGADGLNPGITADPTWTPLWATPAFPSYISGHSTFSAAAATVLDSIYGSNFSFTDPGDPTEALTPETFTSFDQAAKAAGMSRVYGGIHFMSDNLAGLQVGGEVGQYVVQNALLPTKPATRG